MPMSASSRGSRWIVAAGHSLGRASKDDGVPQLEADGHLLHRLEDHRVEPADGAEVEEPQRAFRSTKMFPGWGSPW